MDEDRMDDIDTSFQSRYQYIDIDYPGLKRIDNHHNTPMYSIDNFLDDDLCDLLIKQTDDYMVPAPVVGSGNGIVNQNRTSSTAYLRREDMPTITSSICKLLNKELNHLELPQVGRYQANQEYKPHYDAFQLDTNDGKRFAENGGQRIVTVLIYLNTVVDGGETSFPLLNIQIKPIKGKALIFFPSTLDGILDKNAIHAALPAIPGNDKYVCQIWIRQNSFNGIHNVELAHKI